MGAIAVAGIDLYRRYISPYKGFRCAHNAMHAQGSCSDYGRVVFAERSLRDGMRLMRLRFQECKAAAMVAASVAQSGPTHAQDDDEAKRRKRSSYCDAPSVDCGSASLDCAPPINAIDFCSVGDACACSW